MSNKDDSEKPGVVENEEEEEEEEDEEEQKENEKVSAKQEDPMANYEFDGETYIYTDKTSNITYRFDRAKNDWVVKDENEVAKDTESKNPATSVSEPIYGFENDTHTYTDPTDGSVYMWDKEKSAWFPKVTFSSRIPQECKC